jgi:hypothetical protein
MRRLKEVCCFLLLGVGISHPDPGVAQGEGSFAAGQRIRVTVLEGLPYRESRTGEMVAQGPEKGRRLVGVFRGLVDGSVSLTGEEPDLKWEVPLSTAAKYEVSEGKKGNWAKGMLVGGALGLVGSMVEKARMSKESCDPRVDWCDPLGGEVSVFGSVVLSGLVGALIGTFIRTERWTEVDGPGAMPILSVGRQGRTRLGISIPSRR